MIPLAIVCSKMRVEFVKAKAALHRRHSSVIGTVRTSTGTIVVIEKKRIRTRRYPQATGEPARAPLKG
ncbi:MAG: hypothetical protein QF405_16885 [Roseibacillus sp.]|nr:hypothetical protein [Roseibacillus sp.]HJM64972.1 hypothetical protein [Roseibacillus sp.]